MRAASSKLPVSSAEKHVVSRLQRRQQLADARHHLLDAVATVLDLFAHVAIVRITHAGEEILVELVPGFRQGVVKDDPVGASGERDAVEQVGQSENRLTRAVHGAHAGATGEHERSIDIEQEEFGHG